VAHLSPCKYGHHNDVPVGQKNSSRQKVADKYVLIPSTNSCYLTIAGYGFFFGRLRVPTRRCDLVVPADWGWGRSNKPIGASPRRDYEDGISTNNLVLTIFYGVGNIISKKGGNAPWATD